MSTNDQAAILSQMFEQARSFHQKGMLAQAEQLYGRILAAKGDHFDALQLLGLLRHQQGRPAEALELLAGALKLNPDSVPALANCGLVLAALDRTAEALTYFDKAHRLRPESPEILYNRGNALKALKRPEDALASYEKALAIRPDYPEALNNQGNALLELRRAEPALASFARALAIRPNFAEALNNQGNALRDLRRFADALASYDKALAIRPTYAEALNGRAVALQELRRYGEAIGAYEKVLAVDPDHPYALGGLAHVALTVCDWTRGAQIAGALGERVAQGKSVVQPFTLISYSDNPALHLQSARTFMRDKMPVMPAPLHAGGRRAGGGKIRVAYLSADFRRHPVGFLLPELIERHDRSRFEVHGISFGYDDGSDVRMRLAKAFDRFDDVRASSDRDTARLLHGRQTDIAIDLTGYTMDSRSEILAYRPAPIQANYLGFPATMGVDFIDYIIADGVVLPLDQQPYYQEKIVHLPDSYQVNPSERKVADRAPTRREAGLPDNGFVFCSFNNAYKISAPMFDIWMRLLRAVPGSVLWLVIDTPGAQANLRSEAAARGIDPARLVFADRIDHPDYLARCRLADLFLDTLPYNGHATTSDALWMGLPVLTCHGRTFAGRVGTSLLAAVGLPELATEDVGEYEAVALRLATDPALMRMLREKLQNNRAKCPLFNSTRFCRHLEAAYTRMWEIWQAGESPRSFAVEPL